MAWLDWFTGNKKSVDSARAKHSGSDMPSTLDSIQPGMPRPLVNNAAQAASAQRLEQRRNERNARRELLFQVVRESMVRVGVLSSAFKFKVLSLDQRGRSFLVMIELSAEFSGEAEKLAEIEAMIAHSAKTRYEIIVQAVYWRYFNLASSQASSQVNNVTAVSAPAPLLGAIHAPVSKPVPLYAMDGKPVAAAAPAIAVPSMSAVPVGPTSDHAFAKTMPLQRPASMAASHADASNATSVTSAAHAMTPAAPSPAAKPASRQDDLSDDEVAAFRRALAAGAMQGAAAVTAKPVAPSSKPSPLESARTKLLLTGYEDTEMADEDMAMPALSGTQYGELR
jgi:hypothetical protein